MSSDDANATFARGPRTTVKQRPARASYDRAALFAIFDEALVCHVGIVHDGQPFVLPMAFARVGDRLYLHGAPASRLLRALADGVPCCVTATLLDGLVLARSAFRHSMNYRSAMVLGVAREVVDVEEKAGALAAIVDHALPGRSGEVRAPTAAELRATTVLALVIEEASAKMRSGPPLDDEDDYAWPAWAGELPLRTVALAPLPEARLAAEVAPSPSLARFRRAP